jgi:ABC-type transport system involved in multi-copper enzyme maturation permease subunit
MRQVFKDIFWVAAYELGEAARTRIFQLVILAYAAGIGAACWVLVRILSQLESAAAQTLGVPTTEKPGAMMQRLMDEGQLVELVKGITGNDAEAASLLGEPIVALWAGAAAMALLPLVLVFSTGGSVAAEVRSRSIRYLSCRTGRLEITLGKLAGQLLLGALAALVGAVVAWVLGLTLMVGQPPLALALSLAERSLRALLWSVPFAGLGLAASQLVANPNGARVLAALAVIAMPILDFLAHEHAGTDLLGRLADLGGMFLATRGWSDHWSTDSGVYFGAVLRAAVLAVVYHAIGYTVFTRKDL